MSDCVRLQGINVYAHHGVHPAERELGQRFIIDVDLLGDCSAAAQSDALADALDYTAVHKLVKEATAELSFNLIEAVAGHLCRRLLAEFPVDQVVVTVHKPNPPIADFLGTAAVTLERDRHWFENEAGG